MVGKEEVAEDGGFGALTEKNRAEPRENSEDRHVKVRPLDGVLAEGEQEERERG
jgi:hypothetical protein